MQDMTRAREAITLTPETLKGCVVIDAPMKVERDGDQLLRVTWHSCRLASKAERARNASGDHHG